MTRRRRLRYVAAAATLAVGAMLAGGGAPVARAQAQQQEGPVVFGEKQKTDWLTLQKTRGEFETFYRYRNDEFDPKNGTAGTKFTEHRFEETLTLEGTGAIYHPNLISLDPLSGTFGLSQTSDEVNGEGGQENGTVYEWDLNATMLRKESYVPSLYSRRTRELIDRTFGPTFESTITTTGAVLEIRKQVLPTRLEVYHSETDQTALDESGDFHLSQDAFVWHSEHRPNERQIYNWDYTFNKINQSTGDFETNFDTHDATLSHSIDFGEKAQHNLSSSLHYFNQSGDFNTEQFRWDELLRLRHTDNFETRYQYTFDQNSFSGVDETRNRARVGLRHKLYKSLVTDLSGGVEDNQRSDGADSRQYFFDLVFDYRKQVPLGLLTAGAGGGYNHQINDARTQATQVLDEPHTFTDSIPVVLAGNNIDASSIVVTDGSNLIVFVNGVDYTTAVFPTRVELTRVIGGRIAAGDTVLVDYRLNPQSANVSDTNYYFLSLRYDIEKGPLKGLGIYGRYAKQDQSIDSDNPGEFVENDITDTTVGVDYRFWRMKVGAEQQWHESTISPYDATRFFARYDSPLGSNTNLGIQANYDIIDYKEEDNHVELLTLSATVQHRFSQRLWGYATVFFRDEKSDLQGRTRGIEEQLELQWRYRQTYIYGLLRNSNLESDFQDNSFQLLEVGMRREF